MSSISSSSINTSQYSVASLHKRLTECEYEAKAYLEAPELKIEPKDYKSVSLDLNKTVLKGFTTDDKTALRLEIITSLGQKLICLRNDALFLAENTPKEDSETLEACLSMIQTINTFAHLPFSGEASRLVDRIHTKLDDFVLVDEFEHDDEELEPPVHTQSGPNTSTCIIS